MGAHIMKALHDALGVPEEDHLLAQDFHPNRLVLDVLRYTCKCSSTHVGKMASNGMQETEHIQRPVECN